MCLENDRLPGRAIHVLHVTPTLGLGGMELSMTGVIAGLGGPLWWHSVIALQPPVEIADRFAPSVVVHCLDAPRFDPALSVRLAGLVRRIRPDVIHARDLRSWLEATAAGAFLPTRVPTIFSFHGYNRTGDLPTRWRLLLPMLCRRADRLFAVSRSAREELIRWGAPGRRVEMIPNGVDTDRFRPPAGEEGRQRIRVGTVGRLTAVKDHALLIRACGRLRRQGTDVEVRIAGEGPQRAALGRLADEQGLADRLEMPGRVGDVRAFLCELDVFVLPSRREAMPNALLEAMACGRPCVATAVGGCIEVLDSGRAGGLVPPGDVAALARRIEELAKDSRLRSELARRARERIVRYYGQSNMLQRYARLYRDVARGGA